MTHQIYKVKFDPDKIIAHFGSIQACVVALRSVGMTTKAKTIQKQRERGNMHADMVASLYLASIRLENPIPLSHCLLEKKT